MEFHNQLFITAFISFVHKGRASFFVGKFPGREFPPLPKGNIPDRTGGKEGIFAPHLEKKILEMLMPLRSSSLILLI
jgi:hypothetical protein